MAEQQQIDPQIMQLLLSLQGGGPSMAPPGPPRATMQRGQMEPYPPPPNTARSNFDALRNGGLIDLLTGMDPSQLADTAVSGQGPVTPTPGREDLAVHGLASQQISKRLGPDLARFLGYLNEIGGGAVGLMSGEGFYGPRGFSMEDIMANEQGINSVSPNGMLPLLELLRTLRKPKGDTKKKDPEQPATNFVRG